MGIFSEGVEVVCDPSGQPLTLNWGGRAYIVCAEPTRWFERRQWWAEERRAPLGSGAGLVDHEIWRVQVLPADQQETPRQASEQTSEQASEQSSEQDPVQQFLTLDLVRNIGSGGWRLLRIHDALQPKTA